MNAPPTSSDAGLEVVAVVREPERPLGPPLVPPRVARGLFVVAAVGSLLAVLGVSIWLGVDGLGSGRVVGLGCIAACTLVTVAAGPALTAASGRTGAGWLLTGLAILAGGLWAASTGTERTDAAVTVSVLWVMLAVASVHVRPPAAVRQVRPPRPWVVALVLGGGGSVIIGVLAAGFGPVGGDLFDLLVPIGAWSMTFGLAAAVSGASDRRRRQRRATMASETLPPGARVAFDCPGCGEPRSEAPGMHRCRRCGHRVEVVVNEPRCACGYCLFRIAGTHCPECGRGIRDAERFSLERYEREAGAAGD
ncbi:MAG: hypothetical protein ACYTEV_00295 [Planctomycetota bacterium]|jgi:hypothetical protein